MSPRPVHLTAAGLVFALALPTQAAPAPRPGDEAGLVATVGAPVRTGRAASASSRRAARGLVAAGLRATIFDDATGVPLRAWGKGARTPGVVADATIAAAAGRRALATHLAELAPGAALADFVLVGNVVQGGVRTVGFAQHHAGLPVLGGQVSFAWKRDRLVVASSQALPDVAITPPRGGARPAAVRAAALRGVGARAASATAGVIGARAILPLVRGPGDVTFHVVDPVEVTATGPAGAWWVYVDAATGVAVARRSTLMHGAATLRYQVPDRHVGGTSSARPARGAIHALTLDGALEATTATGDADGAVAWDGAIGATVAPGLRSAAVTVINEGGALAQAALPIADGGEATWDVGADDEALAQLTAFIHGTLVKDHARTFGYPGTTYLDQPLAIYVNEAGACNAYSNGDDIHFFPAGQLDDGTPCGNTGTMADVVYHEYGHSLHIQGLVPGAGEFDSAVSEGLADVLAALITGDPGMGRGFFVSDEPLRQIDPPDREWRWPDDEDFDPHFTGLIIAGAMWDLRTALLTTLTPEATAAKLHEVLWALMGRATDIPSTFVEALLADDDDGDLDNGTPNECAIRSAFGLHGLPDDVVGGLLGTPRTDGLAVALPVNPTMGNPTCPPPGVAGATLIWRPRGEPEAGGEIAMALVDGAWTASLPTPAAPGVLQYQVVATLTAGGTRRFPQNDADPFYEAYAGPLVPVWCASFDEAPDDWTTTGGSADEWTWAAPQPGTSSDDPRAAFTGEAVWGTDLGLGGNYDAQGETSTTTPTIDVRGYDGVRLQYRRWLNVEDGTYDQARIVVDGDPVWSNAVDEGSLHHRDREWRLHDVDLAAQAADGSLSISYELRSDGGLEFGGWTLDDVCVMAAGGDGPPATCGDGVVDDAEACDDGNTDGGDGCAATCELEADGGCCQTGGTPAAPLALGLLTLGALGRRRRRAART